MPGEHGARRRRTRRRGRPRRRRPSTGCRCGSARGEIVGVAGVAGNGQRELHEAIGGLRSATVGIGADRHGRLHAAADAESARPLPGSPTSRRTGSGTGLAPGLTLDENLVLKRFDRPPIARFGVLSTAAIAIRRRPPDRRSFDVRGNRAGMPVSFMSGGNLQKAILARELDRGPRRPARRGADPRARSRRGRSRARPRPPRTRSRSRRAAVLRGSQRGARAVRRRARDVPRGASSARSTASEVDVDAIGLLMTGASAA